MLRPPREPSVAGIMVIGVAASTALSRPGPAEVAAAAGILALHLLTFDPGFDAARRRDLRALLPVAALNAAPYAVAALLLEPAAGPLAAAALLFLAASAAVLVLGPRSPLTYVLGSLVPALPALSIPSALGILTPEAAVFWLLYAIYTTATAAYIESRMPHREFKPWAALAIWAPALPAGLAYDPLLALALAEPTAKFALNAAKPSKVPREGIRRLGVLELARLLAFTAVSCAILSLA